MTESGCPGSGAEHFETADLTEDLRRRSVRGAAATLTAQGAQFVIQLGSTAVLARILHPSSFGLLAMVYAFAVLGGMLSDAGFGMATVQSKKLSHEQASAVFWVGSGVGLLVSLVFAGLAPVFAAFYHDPRLIPLTCAMAPTIFLNAFGMQHQALLRRRMRFVRLGTATVVAQLTAAAVSIALACAGADYWALVARAVVAPAVFAAMLWGLCSWRPAAPRRVEGVRSLLAFGGFLTGARIFVYLKRNLDNVLIGHVWGATALGYYSRAYRLLLLPVEQVTGPVSAIAIPALSRLQNEPERFRRYYTTAVYGLTSISMPLSVFVIVEAHRVVPVLLGDQWTAVIAILQALCVPAFLGSFNIAQAWVFVPLGQTRRQFRAMGVSACLTVCCFFVGLPYGALGVAVAYAASEAVQFLPLTFYSFRRSPLRLRDLGAALWRPAAACTVAGLGARATDHLLRPHLGALLCSGMAFAVCYLVVAWVLAPSRVLRDLRSFVRSE